MCEISFAERWNRYDRRYYLAPVLEAACDLHLCKRRPLGQPAELWITPPTPIEARPAPAVLGPPTIDTRGKIAGLIDDTPIDFTDSSRCLSYSLRRWPKTKRKLSAAIRARRFAEKLLLLELRAMTR